MSSSYAFDLLKELGVTMTFTYLGVTPKNGHMGNMDQFSVTIMRGKVDHYTTVYHSGIGLRNAKGNPVDPKVDDVVNCLMTDANSVAGETFRDYCDNFGSDPDSRAALDTYLACQDTLIMMRKLFGGELQSVMDACQD